MWGGRRGGGLVPSDPLPIMTSQYSCSVRTFIKLTIIMERIKMIQIPCLDICSILVSGQLPHRSNSSHLFWNLKDLELAQDCRRGGK